MRRLTGGVLLALAIAPHAFGQGRTRPDTPEQVADRALAAFRVSDTATLGKLAGTGRPDPWLVTDELCARGEHDAAAAFAEAAGPPALRTYVESRRTTGDDPKARQAFQAAFEKFQSGRTREALEAFEELEGDGLRAVQIAYYRGLACIRLFRYGDAIAPLTEAADLADGIGWTSGAAHALSSAGSAAEMIGKWERARTLAERLLALETKRGNESGRATALLNVGSASVGLGRFQKAREALAEALELSKRTGNLMAEAETLDTLGELSSEVGDYRTALQCFQDLLSRMEAFHHTGGVAMALTKVGQVQRRLGRVAEALDDLERARELHEQVGQPRGLATTYSALGVLFHDLDDLDRARTFEYKALAVAEESGDAVMIGEALLRLAVTDLEKGEYEEARKRSERAMEVARGIPSPQHEGLALMSLGQALQELGSLEEAAAALDRALELCDAGAAVSRAAALVYRSRVSLASGEDAEAMRLAEDALAMAREMGEGRILLLALDAAAAVHAARGDDERVIDLVREAHESMQTQFGGLADVHSVGVRSPWQSLFDAGLHAAVRRSNPAEVWRLLENVRANALLEALGGRDAMRQVTLPDGLREEEERARVAEAGARRRHEIAVGGGNLDAIRKAEGELEAARKVRFRTIARIQRRLKRDANLSYPEADSLEGVRKSLHNGAGLVLYRLMRDASVALVVTRESARIVELAGREEIASALAGIALSEEATPSADAVDALRRLVLDPLELGDGLRTLLVSPDGVLFAAPFGLLARGRTVAYLPSGTTYSMLDAAEPRNGEGVLAVGNPAQGVSGGPGLSLLRRDGSLGVIPGAAAEARAVGSVVLTGEEATETSLRNRLRERDRWRAVHLACHGLVNREQPLLSSLALGPDDRNDGLLTTLDIFGMGVPADLVVLSACESAHGKVYRGEGVLGFVRAFMFAGSPRVVVSLWKVDDEATRALMVKFYELWNPGDGSKGLPTAEALRKAQEHVRDHRDHPEWKRPYFWAAWQLWGLPD